MHNSAVYLIISKEHKLCYIGESMNVENRWETHKKQLIEGSHYNWHLQRYWNECDFEFKKEIIVDYSVSRRLSKEKNKLLLLMLESETIDKYKKLGYTILNNEDSLQRVINQEKKIFEHGKLYTTLDIMGMIRYINSIRDNCYVENGYMYYYVVPESNIEDDKAFQELMEALESI